MFKNYRNLNGNSNVESYEIGFNYVAVRFRGTPKVYIYSYSSAGADRVERMKVLAEAGRGLNSYINLYCRYGYEK